mgnify:FL=1
MVWWLGGAGVRRCRMWSESRYESAVKPPNTKTCVLEDAMAWEFLGSGGGPEVMTRVHSRAMMMMIRMVGG